MTEQPRSDPLPAIRDRDADYGAWLDAHPDAYLHPTGDEDRRALLAEVDWLLALNAVARMDSRRGGWMDGVKAERERIREAVDGLPEWDTTPALSRDLDRLRAAVLAIVEDRP